MSLRATIAARPRIVRGARDDLGGRGRDAGAPWPERIREDHDRLRTRRPDRERRHDRARRGAHRRPSPGATATGRRLPGRGALPPSPGRSRTWRSRSALVASAGGKRTRRRAPPFPSSPPTCDRTPCRRRSPAARHSGWRSPGRSCTTPDSSSSMSRRRDWTFEVARSSARSSSRPSASFPGVRVLVTHDPVEAMTLADHVVILEGGGASPRKARSTRCAASRGAGTRRSWSGSTCSLDGSSRSRAAQGDSSLDEGHVVVGWPEGRPSPADRTA